MQDVEKTEIRRDDDAKRRRRRSRVRPLYVFVVFLLVIGVGVSLCMTVFFNIETIEIGGESQEYTASDIALASGVHTGDNLMRLDAEEVAQNVKNSLVFIDSVTVEKDYPDILRISVTPGACAYNIVDDSGTLQVSASGKILKVGPQTDASLPSVVGYEPAVRDAGVDLTSKDAQKEQIFSSLTEILKSDWPYPITKIDMTDKYNIVLTIDGRIEFTMGSSSEAAYKITLAETVVTDLPEDKTGYLTMIGDHQCSFREEQSVYPEMTTAAVEEDETLETETQTETVAQ